MTDATDDEIATTYGSSASSFVIAGPPVAPRLAARPAGPVAIDGSVDLRSGNLRWILARMLFGRDHPGRRPEQLRTAVAGYQRQVEDVLEALISLGCRSAACTQAGGDDRGRSAPAASGSPVVDGPSGSQLPPDRTVRPPFRPSARRGPLPRRFSWDPSWATSPDPCPCACNAGGFCGGCGHAGCGGRRAR